MIAIAASHVQGPIPTIEFYIPHNPNEEVSLEHGGKKRNAGDQHFLLFTECVNHMKAKFPVLSDT